MASIWDIIKIKSIAGVEKVTEEQKNLIISDAVSNWTEMGLSQQQIAYGIAAIGIESAFNPDAESPTGPYGLGQFSTDTWNEAVAYYNSNYGGNLDPAQSRDDVSAQIAVMGAWTSKIWTKAQSYANNPIFKGYSVEEIAYALHHESYYSSEEKVKRFLKSPTYNNSNIKGYFTTTYLNANNILGSYYTENDYFSTPQASLLDGTFNPNHQFYTAAAPLSNASP